MKNTCLELLFTYLKISAPWFCVCEKHQMERQWTEKCSQVYGAREMSMRRDSASLCNQHLNEETQQRFSGPCSLSFSKIPNSQKCGRILPVFELGASLARVFCYPTLFCLMLILSAGGDTIKEYESQGASLESFDP